MPNPLGTLVIFASMGPTVAFAAEPRAPETADSAPSTRTQAPEASTGETQAQLDALRERLAQAQATTEQESAERARLKAILDAAAMLVDDRQPAEARSAAAARLGSTGDITAIPFLRAASRLREPAVQVAAIKAAANINAPPAVGLARDALRDETASPDAREQAVNTLVSLKRPDAGEALWETASDREVDSTWRRKALDGLKAGYPDLLAERGIPLAASSGIGSTLTVGASGLTGGMALASIGTWGENPTATTIGAVGGSVIGIGTGVVYTGTHPVSAGQGARYASNVGWGLTAGLMAVPITLGPAPTGSDTEDSSRQNAAAFYRTLGVTAGAISGAVSAQRDPPVRSVLESDLAGYLGLNIGIGIADLLSSGSVDQIWNCRDWYPDSGEPQPDCTAYNRWVHARWGAAAAGTALGLGLQAAIDDVWNPTRADLLFASVAGAEAGWVGGWLPVALGTNDPIGNIHTSLHGGFAAALAAAHYHPFPKGQTAMMAWGAVLGNSVGAGLPLLADVSDDQVISQLMIPIGVAGTLAGAVAAPHVQTSPGDRAMLAVGVPLAIGEAAAMGSYFRQKGVFQDRRQTSGLILTTGSVVGAGLTALSPLVDPKASQMFFLGSAAAWGTWYGTLVPIAFALQLDPAQAVLTATLTGDAFLAAGGAAVTPYIGLEPRSTVIPQLAGATGATLGALGAAMSSAKTRPVATGAVVGSTVGLLAGTVATAAMSPHHQADHASLLPLPHLDPPRRWSFLLSPISMEDGSTGLHAGISVQGW